ncbi:MAG: cyclic nucleotide-binding domain-containing protein [Candidatus Omnitrophica bacterium]|nr:cyclic nucleotide-binding domain-containing protein [Candidatus Omnitrophota bacterium]
MNFTDKDTLLRGIPLFSRISLNELNLIKAKINITEYRKGQIIYQEGSPASCFYCVIQGRVVIYTTDPSGKQTILEYLHHGKYFGIISLLTDEPHSVTAQAINDCLLLEIKKEDFDYLINKIPKLAIDLSQTLSRRLKNKDLHQKTVFESTIISIFSSYSPAGKTIYVLNLALSLKKETHKSVVILDVCPAGKTPSLPYRLGLTDDYKMLDLSGEFGFTQEFILKNRFEIDLICAKYIPSDKICIKRLINILTYLVNDYHYIILDLPSSMDEDVFTMLNQSDFIHILTAPDEVDLKKTHHLIEKLKTELKFSEPKIKVIINEYTFSKLEFWQQKELLNWPVFGTLPKVDFAVSDKLVLEQPDCEYAKTIRRIARQVGDCLVGLALGVGVGYGLCHIGVLKVIEENDIPIDVITGSSIGALIAGLWATGFSSNQILEITKREFKDPKHIWGFVDLTFPTLGFIKGRKIYSLLKKYFDDKSFYDTRLPLRIVASDIKRKETVVFESGALVDAIIASCAMPGVFRPFAFKGDLILDGGVINPLPTEVLLKMGVKKIIAVSVTPSREDSLRQYEKIKEKFAETYKVDKKRWWPNLKILFQNKFKANILDIIFSSIEVMQSEIIQKEAQLADIVLHPNTEGMHWLELHRAEEFAHRGEEEARKNLDRIWQLINE